jgi:hypothetical protein
MSCTQDINNNNFYSCTADKTNYSYIKNISTSNDSYLFVPAYKELPSICKNKNKIITCTYTDASNKKYTTTLTNENNGYFVQNISK